MLSFINLLAQNGQPADPGNGGGAGSPSGSPMFIGLIIMIGVFMFFMFRGSRKEQKKRASMLDSLQKNTKVMTIGGIVGTVVQVKDNEVVLKVDESTNTKMTFLKRAIQQVITEDQDLSAANKQT